MQASYNLIRFAFICLFTPSVTLAVASAGRETALAHAPANPQPSITLSLPVLFLFRFVGGRFVALCEFKPD